MEKAIEIHACLTGEKPAGWYTDGLASTPVVWLHSMTISNMTPMIIRMIFRFGSRRDQSPTPCCSLAPRYQRYAVRDGLGSTPPSSLSIFKSAFDVLYSEGEATLR